MQNYLRDPNKHSFGSAHMNARDRIVRFSQKPPRAVNGLSEYRTFSFSSFLFFTTRISLDLHTKRAAAKANSSAKKSAPKAAVSLFLAGSIQRGVRRICLHRAACAFVCGPPCRHTGTSLPSCFFLKQIPINTAQ